MSAMYASLRAAAVLAFIWVLFGYAPASLTVSGGITVNGVAQPLLFTWNSTVTVSGAGWSPGESVRIVLHGPLDSPGARPRPSRVLPRVRNHQPFTTAVADIPLGTFTADAQGNFSANASIPYDSGETGANARIPRPGYYEVRGIGVVTGIAAASAAINLAPSTYTGGNAPIDWGHERGGREGVLPGNLREFSPERSDPEWPTVWDAHPVAVYGTVAPTSDGAEQPAMISPSDDPITHYAHDAIFFLVPDMSYQWQIGTANYYAGDVNSPELSRLEVEWETLNGGSTGSYGQGNIGLPLWATPSASDRVYVVGAWILDAGHPELGDRTEIHPPRLLATMRMRPATAANGAAAAQVDIYASGHGGGANHTPPGLTAILDRNGHGGGRIRDVLSPGDQQVYYRPGPLSPLLASAASLLLSQLTGQTISLTTFADAGPSAFPWGTPGPEERPINDMDYDFDVPLPPRPAGASRISVDVTTQPQHTTAVTELVEYADPVNGFPTVAHVHLGYRGADSGIYARTLKFYWNDAPPPATHAVVRLDRIDVKDSPGKWQVWADVSGRWVYLSGLAPVLLDNSAGQSVALPANATDVFLNPGGNIRVYVQGYRAACLDSDFGQLFGESAYVAGLSFLGQCGPTDNLDLGGAVLEVPPTAGNYTAAGSHFSVAFSVAIAP